MEVIAFYLPQYHPIPENDAWWGKGFTEWTNVVKTRPRFAGHYQPHVPADLGYYDLRQPEARQSQAAMAARYGVTGFCYFHYWFGGRRLLSRPLDDVLGSGEPDFPFCLCWANENWCRTWDGTEEDVLIEQTYSENDDLQHGRWLAGVFQDRRYFRVDGKPVLLVYRACNLPDPLRTTGIWREEARRQGIGELYLARVESFGSEKADPTGLGFDGAVEFQPDWERQPAHDGVFDYRELAERARSKAWPSYEWFRCVTPSWDNSPRRQSKATVYDHSSPGEYGQWLGSILHQVARRESAKPLVFVNAWNEWGEGNHLEPCVRWKKAYLEATLAALQEHRSR